MHDVSHSRPGPWQVRPVSLLVFLLLLLSACSTGTNSQYIKWHFVVPNGYHGYLAIRYDCPGGQPIPIQDHTARIGFQPDGSFCTSDSFVASWSDGDTAETAQGQVIPVYPDSFDSQGQSYHGYGLYGGDTLGVGGHTQENPGEDMTFAIYWVGNMEEAFKAHKADGAAYPDDQHAFLATRFG
jgi:hypothetical protein